MQGLGELLHGFDPKEAYATTKRLNKATGEYEYFDENNVPVFLLSDTRKHMDEISALITLMTIRGATSEELARAVKHSMTLIDAEKHHLDYKASERDNDIETLKRKYMASSDISRRFESMDIGKAQQSICRSIRSECIKLAHYISTLCPNNREQSLALTKLEECAMWANKSISRFDEKEEK